MGNGLAGGAGRPVDSGNSPGGWAGGRGGLRKLPVPLAKQTGSEDCHSDMVLVPGDIAPDFTAPVVGEGFAEGEKVTLSVLRGAPVILYFYPKDDTPGCTKQACSLRDRYSDVIENGARVFGVSIDPVESHKKFILKYNLPFPLISDTSREIVQAFGVWVERSMYGKKYFGTERSTFVINPEGRIKSIYRKVKPEEHTVTVIEDLRHFEP